MHILYIGGFNLPDKNAAAQRVVANAKILRELGYEVSLVGMTRDKEGLDTFEYEGFECKNLPYPETMMAWLKTIGSINQYLSFFKQDTSIVIAYNYPAVALKKLLKHNKKHGIRTLADCTEWYEQTNGRKLFRIIKGWDVNQRMYKVHCQLDGVITISRFLYDFYKERNVHTLLLPPLVDKSDAKWHQPLNGNDHIIRLLYAGSSGKEKDRLDIIISALETIVPKYNISCQFDVIGFSEKQYITKYLNNGVWIKPSYVHFHGRLPHKQVIAMLLSADFQICIREDRLLTRAGFPTKFVETISAGAIALTNASSNLKDYMVEGVNSFELDINDKSSLMKSLTKPLSLSKKEIEGIRKQINTEMFDYRFYIEPTRSFLNCVKQS